MIVCVCNNISESDLRHAVEDGAHSLRKLSKQTGLGTNCGSCLQTAKAIMKDHLAEMTAANPDLFYAA